MKELICICCPRGCYLQVDETNNYAVAGNGCPRGADYGKAECTAPTRVVTSTVKITGAEYPRCPVKTAAPVPKGKVFAVTHTLEGLEIAAPVAIGQVVVADAAGTGVDLVATRAFEKKA